MESSLEKARRHALNGRGLSAWVEKEAGAPKGSRHGVADQAATSCRASATSTESPSWFSTTNPDSGTSPDVLCETMIFQAISPRQVICEEAA